MMETRLEDAFLTTAETVLAVALPVIEVVTNILAFAAWW